MRSEFSNSLVTLAMADSRVLLLTGDHGYSLFDSFREECPKQYINAGIAEQNMIGMAAGLARVGYRPIVYGLAAFVPIRVIEQIKIDVAHDQLPVIIIGDGAGFVYSHLGTSHQSMEDIACTRGIPNLSILSPADSYEMKASMRLAYELNGPVYLRMGKSDLGAVHNAHLNLDKSGRLLALRKSDSTGLGFVATGSMVASALKLADEFNSPVWSVPTIKPLNISSVLLAAKSVEVLVVLEEHSIYGGLGSAISEILSEHYPCKIVRIGVKDTFSQKCGSYEYLLSEHGLDLESIRKTVGKLLPVSCV